jgi:hypothetical protein
MSVAKRVAEEMGVSWYKILYKFKMIWCYHFW